jgi:hypothetical protein
MGWMGLILSLQKNRGEKIAIREYSEASPGECEDFHGVCSAAMMQIMGRGVR